MSAARGKHPCPCIEISETNDRSWSWSLLAHNGRPIATGIVQVDRKSAYRAIRGFFKAVAKVRDRVYVVAREDSIGARWLDDWTRMGGKQVSPGLAPCYEEVGRRTIKGRAGIRAESRRRKIRRR